MLSVCLIAKNEEQLLKDCLQSVKDFADEIIFVDTGSTDSSKEIAKEEGAEVFDFEWQDDFSAARNFANEKAKGDWILVLDADEVLAEESKEQIKQLIENKDEVAYELQVRTYCNAPEHQDWKPLKEIHKDFKGYYDLNVTRLFRNQEDVFFSGKVHETIHDSLRKLNKKPKRVDLLIHHYEFLKDRKEVDDKKISYYELLKKKIEENPKDAYSHHLLGIYLRDIKKDVSGSLKCFQNAIVCNRKCKEAYNDLAILLFQLGQVEEGIKVLHVDIAVNNDPNAFLNLAILFFKAKDYDAVLRTMDKLEETLPGHNVPKAYALRGKALIEKKDFEKAAVSYEKAISLDPINELYKKQLALCKEKKAD